MCAVLMDIDVLLSTNWDKPSDAKILAEIWGQVVPEEETDDISVVYDEQPELPSVLEVNRATVVLQQLILLCDEEDNLIEVLAKVNRYSQRAIVKQKK